MSRRVELISIDSNQSINNKKRTNRDDNNNDDDVDDRDNGNTRSNNSKRTRIETIESNLLKKLFPFDCLVTLPPFVYARFYSELSDFLERAVSNELDENETFQFSLDYINGLFLLLFNLICCILFQKHIYFFNKIKNTLFNILFFLKK